MTTQMSNPTDTTTDDDGPITEEEIRAMPWTRDLMTAEQLQEWVASREEAGRAIDIATCELGRWAAYDCDPYGVRDLPEQMQQIGTNRFVRSPESRGWVHEGDLPTDKGNAMYDRIHCEWALFVAATEKHPGWRPRGNARYPTRIDDTAPEFPELIEWFRKSFPHEASAIEAAVVEEGERRVAEFRSIRMKRKQDHQRGDRR